MLNDGEEIRSPKSVSGRIRRSTGLREEFEEPSAVSVPLKPLFRFDKQCSEKKSYWQLVVMNEGGEAYTTNLSQKCFNKNLRAKGRRTAVKCAVETGS